VCQIEYVVPKQYLTLMRGKWYHKFSSKPKYYRARYEVRAIIGAGLSFQIWGDDGLMSKSHDEIEVMWQPVDGKETSHSSMSERRGDELYVVR
jgi:hypothetical protein